MPRHVGQVVRSAMPNGTVTPLTASAKPIRTYEFVPDQVDGDRIRPDGTTIFGLRQVRHGSLIRLRGDFLREIVQSAEHVE